jgi:hypothetical protein
MQEFTESELRERVAELEAKKANSTSIMRVAELQDEIDSLTGEANRRAINLKASEDSDYECIGCSG